MKPVRKFAKEIAGHKGTFSIKVKVLHITSVHASLENQINDYQIIHFEDEEGTKLHSILYNNSLSEMEAIIEDNMEYDISYATVEKKHNLYSKYPDDHTYELHLNVNTMVDRIISTKNGVPAKYVLIAHIPKTVCLGDRYDVLGVVVYVDSNCQIIRPNGATRDICEVLIVDQSSEQIITVIAWEDQDIEECNKLESIAESFPLIAFTALRSTPRKGFSLATTPKSKITIQPTGNEAGALRSWVTVNKDLLAEKSYMVSKVREKHNRRCLITLGQLVQQNPKHTMQEEELWLRVQLSKFNIQNLNVYLGCSNCGTGNCDDIGQAYTCYACFTKDVVSCPRMAITFEAQDGTGSYTTFTAQTGNAEKLLQVSATDLYAMLPQEKDDYLGQIERQLKDTQVYIQVALAASFSEGPELIWVLKRVSMT